MDPVISVIIPVYNAEKYLKECLTSVLTQGIDGIEILCVDDASSDGSLSLLERFAGEDDRLRVIRNQTNLGQSAARNAGLELAGGEYIYFLDDDDILAPGALSQLLEKMRGQQLDAHVFCMRFLFEEDAFRSRFADNRASFKQHYEGVFPGKELLVRWMEEWDWTPATTRWIYSRSFLNRFRIRYRESITHEDEVFTLDVLMHAARVSVGEEEWLIRRFHAGSVMTRTPGFHNIASCMTILSVAAAYTEQNREDPRLTNALAIYRRQIAKEARRKFSLSGADGGFRVSVDGPLLSVVIPVYNTAPYLSACLESIQSQDFDDMEILIVDDGSTDGSADILRSYAAMDPRITVITFDENRGQAAARNAALAAAGGKYVYMSDSDDLIRPGTLSRLCGVCEEQDADLVGFENEQFSDVPDFDNEACEILFSYEKTQGTYSGRDAFITCVMQDTLSPSVPTFFLRRDLLTRNGIAFTEGILHEDIGFIFELFMHARKVCLLHEKYYRRRFRSHSTVTSAFSADHARGYLTSWKKAFEQEAYIRERYGADPAFLLAVDKWKRDVLGRIRVLYLGNEAELFMTENIRELIGLGNQSKTECGRENRLKCDRESRPECDNKNSLKYDQDDRQKSRGEGCRANDQKERLSISEVSGQGNDPENRESALLLEILRCVTMGPARAEHILGAEACARLKLAGEVYICGAGQYARRTAEAVGALGIRIKGFIMQKGERAGRDAFLGFPILVPEEVDDPGAAVIPAVSWYHEEEVLAALSEVGLHNIIRVGF